MFAMDFSFLSGWQGCNCMMESRGMDGSGINKMGLFVSCFYEGYRLGTGWYYGKVAN